VSVGYVSQHAEELEDEGSVLDAVQRATGLTPGKARALLGHFLFSGDEVRKPVAGLSGGERRRVSLAILVNSGANMLVLDEPTNHLDIESREALEDALRGFPGSLLLVSHDRALLDAVGSRTLAVEDGELHSYEGSWAEYVQAREERRAAADAPRSQSAAGKGRRKEQRVGSERGSVTGAKSNGRQAGLSKNAQRAQRALEREIEAAEAALRRLEDELADPGAWADAQRASASGRRHAEAKRELEELYARWEHTSK
jgi:ATP-binding cassette subfamily F protein 3